MSDGNHRSYQPGGSSGFNGSADPLSDASACLRDAALMQRLGVSRDAGFEVVVYPDRLLDQCGPRL